MLWCHLARMAPYASPAVGVPRWLEMTDAVSLTMERAAKLPPSGLSLRRFAFELESRRMRRMERRLADEFDLISLISSVDRDTALGCGAGRRDNVLVAPNGVEIPAVSGVPAGQRPPAIAMIGRMDSIANRDALWHFVEEILPGVMRRVPDARLHVIGHVKASDARQLRRFREIQVEGVVPDMGTVLRTCRVGVCPVRIGAGIQNKLLDYMAHGLASVSSPIGLEGLKAREGQELAVANSSSQWVDLIVGLLLDDSQASRLGAAGRALVEREYRWATAMSPLVDRVDALLSPNSAINVG
jgi:glycosyltransferase involved in cell wall biosynthesis